jgi:hypothetical protein
MLPTTFRIASWFGSICLVAALAGGTRAEEPKAESWVMVSLQAEFHQQWLIRVDGGPVEQVKPTFDKAARKPAKPRPFPYGDFVEDDRRFVYTEPDPDTVGPGKKFKQERRFLKVCDADGSNAKVLQKGLRNGQFWLSRDAKSILCSAERESKWQPLRVFLDGSPPAVLSKTSSLESSGGQEYAGGKFIYMPVTGYDTRPVAFGTYTMRKGPIILIEGATETELVKEWISGALAITDDVSTMAYEAKGEDEATVLRLKNLKTGKIDEIPISAFHKDWNCQFRRFAFRPDGKALAVSRGAVVFREKGPLPGDEAVQHFGVVWLDGRKNRVKTFKVDAPLKAHGYHPEVDSVQWTTAPVAKK